MCAEEAGQTGGPGTGCCGPAARNNEAGDRTEACPVAAFVQQMASTPGLGPLLLIPGLVFLVGGVLVLIAPTALVWLLAGTSIVLGLGLLWLARTIRRLLAQPSDP